MISAGSDRSLEELINIYQKRFRFFRPLIGGLVFGSDDDPHEKLSNALARFVVGRRIDPIKHKLLMPVLVYESTRDNIEFSQKELQ